MRSFILLSLRERIEVRGHEEVWLGPTFAADPTLAFPLNLTFFLMEKELGNVVELLAMTSSSLLSQLH